MTARTARAIVFAAGVCALLHALSYFYVTSDDAYISLRYARNLANGLGLSYNPGGPPVEGFSNPVFTVAAAALMWMGASPLRAVKGLGLLCLLGVFAVLAGLCGRDRGAAEPAHADEPEPGRSPSNGRRNADAAPWCSGQNTAVAIAAVLTAASPYFAVAAINGLETMQYSLFLLVATVLALRETGPEQPRWTPLAFVAVAASRPEGALAAAAVAATQWTAARFQLGVVRAWTARFALPCVLLLALRWLRYGSLTPNTYAAKVAFGSEALRAGLAYCSGFLRDGGYWLLLPALAAIVVAIFSRRRGARATVDRAALWLIAAPALSQLLFALAVGGDFMPAYRFIVPVYPLFCLLSAVALVAATRPLLPGPRSLAATLFAVFVMAAGGYYAQESAWAGHPSRFWFIHEWPASSYLEQTDLRGTWLEAHQSVGEFVALQAASDDVLVVTEAGAIPFYAGLHTVDLLGLNDAAIATMAQRALREGDRSQLGQRIAEYAFSFRPRWVVLDGHFNPATGGFRPRLDIAWWLVRNPAWLGYRPVFTAKVYDGTATGLGDDRIDVVFERIDAGS